MKVKICGVTTMEDALFCAGAGADLLGFIFYEASPRFISPALAAKIIARLPSGVTPVGVFVNQERAAIERTTIETAIRLIQLSGDERPDDCRGFGVPVVKAFRLRSTNDAEQLREYHLAAAMLDSATGSSYGGSGVLADFSVALAMKAYHPLFLAGGLTPDNVADAAARVRPYAVDVNSGVEASPGKKDHAKVSLLFERLGRHHPTII